MDPIQIMLNAAFALVAFLGSLFINRLKQDNTELKQEIKDLRARDELLNDKIHMIAEMVASFNAHRDNFEKSIEAIFKKLDRIENKLDGKADK